MIESLKIKFNAENAHRKIYDLCALCGKFVFPFYFPISLPPALACHTTRRGLATKTDE
jgi:hypothetical protein